jgi:Fur family transcriptional regulator, ferric uptake regulator
VIEADLSVAEPFAEHLRETFGFDTDIKHFAIFGRCAECSARERAQQSGQPSGERTSKGSGEPS